MHWFQYKGNSLNAEEIPLIEIAEKYGTPSYVYSQQTIERHAETIDGAFNGIDHLTCYSVKSNWNLSILKILASKGLGADIVSGGELFRALRAGFSPKKIVYSGVGKTEREIKYALDSGILMLNIESESELEVINKVAGEMGIKAPISFRINPDVDPKTHPYISTGLKKNKFGIPHEKAIDVYKKALSMKNIDVIGIDAHIGSQLTDVSPFKEAAERLFDLVGKIKAIGADIKFIDIGGGLGINYQEENPPNPNNWADMILPVLKETNSTLIIEPGRSIIGNAGILLTRVLYIKNNGTKTFIVVDAGMNDLARPSLYGSYHSIIPVEKNDSGTVTADIVGPICESGDFLAKDRDIQLPKEGDILAVMSAGAYGITMSSNYNSRTKPAEIMVNGKNSVLAARRETYDDLISRENFD